jgi:hypothetical protein
MIMMTMMMMTITELNTALSIHSTYLGTSTSPAYHSGSSI